MSAGPSLRVGAGRAGVGSGRAERRRGLPSAAERRQAACGRQFPGQCAVRRHAGRMRALLVLLSAAAVASCWGQACPPAGLVVYKVVLHTFWTRDRFPKHYPDWRPAAQWSRLVGRSHDASYALFRLGQRVGAAARQLAETGGSQLLQDDAQGAAGLLDAFSAPAVAQGAGRAEAEFFLDGNHSRVSLMSKIVPSPDWFIGVDSLDLCVEGSWVDSVTVEADPLDAGTDNGFTFTAPNWPTEPQGEVYKVTSRYPSHRAGSFYYPYKRHLPPIATFQFIKRRTYELAESFQHSQDERHYDVVGAEDAAAHRDNSLDNEIQAEMEVERAQQEAAAGATGSTGATSTAAPQLPGPVRKGDKSAILNSIVQTYRARRKGLRKPRKHPRKTRPPRDCRAGDWSAWSACSRSCGIGEMRRTREVVRFARRGGKACPPLVETKWCGSARACAHSYFDW
ncbi:uncharacterized protein LOC134531320 [Bacillus rossius redtenbacheri]|uniref:uncharacterized protein LOC134531320 n=1 Tax=Bacillus rossius redtenbacheri TaxID=93214 RepID=UPI002FDE7644